MKMLLRKITTISANGKGLQIQVFKWNGSAVGYAGTKWEQESVWSAEDSGKVQKDCSAKSHVTLSYNSM